MNTCSNCNYMARGDSEKQKMSVHVGRATRTKTNGVDFDQQNFGQQYLGYKGVRNHATDTVKD